MCHFLQKVVCTHLTAEYYDTIQCVLFIGGPRVVSEASRNYSQCLFANSDRINSQYPNITSTWIWINAVRFKIQNYNFKILTA